MHYFLSIRTVGACAQHALGELSPQTPLIVHTDGTVYDLNPPAAKAQIPLGLPLKEAKVILQNRAQYIEYLPERFQSVAKSLLEPCLNYCNSVQAMQAAEALVDLTPHPDPLDIATRLLHDLAHELQVPIKAGIAPAVWIAKASAQFCDPAALRFGILPIEPILEPAEWLKPQPIQALTPLDRADQIRLQQLGFSIVDHVQKAPLARLEQQFPKRGLLIQQTALGRWADPFRPNYPSQMISAQANLGGCDDLMIIQSALQALAIRLAEKLSRDDSQCAHIRLVVGFEDQTRKQSQRSLIKPLVAASQLNVVLNQLLQMIPLAQPIDLIRAQLLDLKPTKARQTRFDLGVHTPAKPDEVSSTINRIEASLGTGSIQVASKITQPFNALVLKEWKRATQWR
jgi:hypothetical protein